MNTKSKIRLFLLLLGLLVIPLGFGRAQEGDFSDTFDDPNLPGWEITSGVSVVDGVLRIETGGSATYNTDFGDLKLSFRLRSSSGGELKLSYRFSDAGAYHVLFNAERMLLQRETGVEVKDLAFETLPPNLIGAHEWMQLVITVFGDKHTISLDGVTLLTHSDADPLLEGRISLAVPGEASIDVDDFSVTDRESSEPSSPANERHASLPWISTGGPIGGLGYDVRMLPDNPDVMYVTDDGAGAFKSVDGGATWFSINEGITTRIGDSNDGVPVFCLTIDPNNIDRIWVGTSGSSGVFRSDDGGDTWTKMRNGITERGLNVRGFTVEPGNSEVVYLAGEISSWEWFGGETKSDLGFDLTKGVVYKTVDAGQNWSRIWEGDNLARYIWIHPDNPDLLFVSTGIFDRLAANSNLDAGDPGGVGVLRNLNGGDPSTSSGQAWELLGVERGFHPDDLYIGSLFMHPTNPDNLLAAAGNDPYATYLGRPMGGIYFTEDGGDSWVEVLDGHNFSAVEYCESNPNVAYAGAVSGFFRSEDGGRTWEQRTGELWGPSGIIVGFPIDLQCDPRDPNRIFINNYGGGNFLSEDGGATWVISSAGYTGAHTRQIAIDPQNPSQVYVTVRSAIFASSDAGVTWHGLANGAARALEAHVIAVDPGDSRHILATVMDIGPNPLSSYDGGVSWQEIDTGIFTGADHDAREMVTKIVFSPSNPNIVYAAASNFGCLDEDICVNNQGRGVIVSRDGGQTWSQTSLSSGNIMDLAVFPKDANVVYAAVFPGSVYRSYDAGVSWEQVAENLPSGADDDSSGPSRVKIWALAVDPKNSKILYAGFKKGGVMVSSDGGQTWRATSAGMAPEASVSDFAIDPTSPNIVYAATKDSGVFISMDGGGMWQAINEGLSNRSVVGLALSTDGSILYAATDGAGVFRLGTPSK